MTNTSELFQSVLYPPLCQNHTRHTLLMVPFPWEHSNSLCAFSFCVTQPLDRQKIVGERAPCGCKLQKFIIFSRESESMFGIETVTLRSALQIVHALEISRMISRDLKMSEVISVSVAIIQSIPFLWVFFHVAYLDV